MQRQRGSREHWGTQSEGFQEGELRWPGTAEQDPFFGDDCNHDASHRRGHHECRGFGRVSAVPSGKGGFRVLHVRPHGSLHESPDHKGDDEHHAEGVDSRRGLEEEVVDHERILEGEVAFDPVLPLVGGHYPADAALGLETGHTSALLRLASLEGADESAFQKAEKHLLETGGIRMDARQIQRLVQRVGLTAQAWQQREYKPGQEDKTPVPIMYVSANGTGVPMRQEELEGRAGKQADGTAKIRQAYLGCVFAQHGTDEKGRPVWDWASTTYISSMESIDAFAPRSVGKPCDVAWHRQAKWCS